MATKSPNLGPSTRGGTTKKSNRGGVRAGAGRPKTPTPTFDDVTKMLGLSPKEIQLLAVAQLAASGKWAQAGRLSQLLERVDDDERAEFARAFKRRFRPRASAGKAAAIS